MGRRFVYPPFTAVTTLPCPTNTLTDAAADDSTAPPTDASAFTVIVTVYDLSTCRLYAGKVNLRPSALVDTRERCSAPDALYTAHE